MKRLILAAVLICLNCIPAIGDNDSTTTNIAPAIDSQIFKRTPVIDGIVESGEWDNFYSVSNNGLDAATYVDWDSSNLYFAVKANQAVEALISIDGNADGWFNGDENYDIRLLKDNATDMRLHVGRYDSKKARVAISSPISDADMNMIVAKTGEKDGSSMIEIKIPIDALPSISIKDGKVFGLLFAIKKAGAENTEWIPTAEQGQTNECTFVTKKIASLKPIQMGFDLKDTRIARGEELIGKFHLTNSGNESVDVKDFVIAGEGKSGEYLSSEKVRLDGLISKKHVSTDVRSIIPANMPLGNWAIGAEVKTPNSRIGGALISFEVVEPYEVELKLPEKPVYANAKDITVGIVVKNNCRHHIRGNVKITIPDGWESWKNAKDKEFAIQSEDTSNEVIFKIKPTIGALGKIPIKVDVECGGISKTVEGSFEVVNPL